MYGVDSPAAQSVRDNPSAPIWVHDEVKRANEPKDAPQKTPKPVTVCFPDGRQVEVADAEEAKQLIGGTSEGGKEVKTGGKEYFKY
jgi:hypothetical protein